MAIKLKPIGEQVVVVLGASSGIGRETATRLAAEGAKVVVAARSEAGLRSLVDEIRRAGGEAMQVVCDVADFEQVKMVAEKAAAAYGRIDTWVNNAAVALYARVEETTPDEFRRIMDVNYMGQVHGALAALPHLRKAGGGALIAISSVESIVALPLHSAYSASKHAVEGFVDALRRELQAEGAPISVTSIKPGTINTPFFNNARNKMDVKPMGPPPIYHPGVVADCVLHAATHPVRDLFAGGAARAMAAHQMLLPRLVDAALSAFGISAARTDQPTPGGTPGNLDAPRLHDNRAEGDFTNRQRRTSLYTWLETHPFARRAAKTAAALGGLAMMGAGRGRRDWSRSHHARGRMHLPHIALARHSPAIASQFAGLAHRGSHAVSRRSSGAPVLLMAALPLGYLAWRLLSGSSRDMATRGEGGATANGDALRESGTRPQPTSAPPAEPAAATGSGPGLDASAPESGLNARPLDGTLAQSGAGLPDDGASPVEITPEEQKRIADRIRNL